MICKIVAAALILFALVCIIANINFETAALCALFFAALLLIVGAKRTSKRLKTAARIAGVAAFAVLTVFVAVILSSGHDDAVNEPRDFVVVLGAKAVGNEPGVTLRERLDKALRYAQEHPNAVIFVTGGQGENEVRPEGDIMADYLVAHGLSTSRIVTESAAKNTRENLILCGELAKKMGMDAQKPVIITSDFHILRAKFIARSLSMEPAGIVCRTGNPFLRVNYALREVFSFVKAVFVALTFPYAVVQ